MVRVKYLFIVIVMCVAQSVSAAWDFRGDPNAWESTRMTQVSATEWVITQAFGAEQTAFKIARDDGWVVSFPVENFIVEPDNTYQIQFFDDVNQIVVTPVDTTWNFRGTPNGWGESPMTNIGNGEFQICQSFANGDDGGGARFKIARENWNESFPAADFSVSANRSHMITFAPANGAITVVEVASCETDAVWNFRGTPNQWGATAMVDIGSGLFETCQSFASGDADGGARFKIASEDLGWDLAFPAGDFSVAANQDFVIQFDENTEQVSVSPVAFCNAPDGLTIVGQKTRFTLVDVPFLVSADMIDVSGASEFAFNVFPGENYTLAGNVVTPDAGFEGELNIVVNVATADETSPDFGFKLPVIELNRDRNLIVHTAPVLSAPGVDLGLVRMFNQLAAQSNENGLTGVQLFRQFWDTQNTSTGISVGPNCGDETLADGVSPALNGFPIGCNRAEGLKVRANDDQVLLEMASYFPIAAVNRFDLHSADFSDCGEHRMIYARGNSNGFGRNFIIAEARVANPEPGVAAGCQPLVNFWLGLNQTSEVETARAIETAYFDGIENFPAIMSIEHFEADAGQIRTNQFITLQWMLREYKLAHTCENGACELRALPVTVKENPFGPLFNGNEATSGTEFSDRAAAFQADFLANIGTLTNNDAADLTIKTGDMFNNGRSHASGQTSENDFDLHFSNGAGSPFFDQLNTAAAQALDANGVPLTAQQILNRATALTCGGCHQPSTFGLTNANALGAMRLPDGSTIDRWPFSSGFVHVSEFASRNGVFGLSSALNTVFLPVRASVLEDYLTTLAQ